MSPSWCHVRGILQALVLGEAQFLVRVLGTKYLEKSHHGGVPSTRRSPSTRMLGELDRELTSFLHTIGPLGSLPIIYESKRVRSAGQQHHQIGLYKLEKLYFARQAKVTISTSNSGGWIYRLIPSVRYGCGRGLFLSILLNVSIEMPPQRLLCAPNYRLTKLATRSIRSRKARR